MTTIHDYQLSPTGLYVRWSEEGHEEVKGSYPLELVAAILYEIGVTNGYTNDACIIGAHFRTVAEVWETIGGDRQVQVAHICAP